MKPSAPPKESRSTRLERLLPGSLELVWRHLTEPELLAQWLAVSRIELREGGRVELQPLRTEGPEQRPSERTVQGVVTRCEPPRVLSFTWSEADTPHSEVTFELTPQGEKVRLVLTHWRAPLSAVALGGAGAFLDSLASRLGAPGLRRRARSRVATRPLFRRPRLRAVRRVAHPGLRVA
ncbi:SRPBCC domain-containing protein [Pyxidicoccus parkwayensis]|uniref:SRPBCC domain-containing protein n=1 Tax=Pyxidicoccus parkwayensis TaxID=2813578 RepID=A0ABX7PAT1_9BACT|nr:SRPBCC domain-containing protein [Pyxidicoccus parkwaysis]QSQ27571.1 SRPBCC domain-containing protein [Pyxidicoccus parkwaysis]